VDVHFHDLRREFACRLLESRAELHDVRDFLGHANITTTSRYLRSTPLRLARALSLLEVAESRLFPHGSHIRRIRSLKTDRTNPRNRLISKRMKC
jgi:hypothetical protein